MMGETAAGHRHPLTERLTLSLEAGRLPAELFADREIFELEQISIFGRSWSFVGHESEVPSAGDFVVRPIGVDRYIVVRCAQGDLHVFLDACRHRGAGLAREHAGQTRSFVCMYHGWTYSLCGDLTRKRIAESASPSGSSMVSLRVETFRGLVFACLDRDTPRLTECLGGMSWYLDLCLGMSGRGVRVVAGPQRFSIRANWKSAAENFCGDDAHVGVLHASVWKLGMFDVPMKEQLQGIHVTLPGGHSLSLSLASDGAVAGATGYFGATDMVRRLGGSALDPIRDDVAARARVLVANVFPNLSLLATPVVCEPRGEVASSVSLRLWQPVGPQEIEVWSWFLCDAAASDMEAERSRLGALRSVAQTGVFDIDDPEPWQAIARTASSAPSRLGLELDYSSGLTEDDPVEDWPGPGTVRFNRAEEGVQRNFYAHYALEIGKRCRPDLGQTTDGTGPRVPRIGRRD